MPESLTKRIRIIITKNGECFWCRGYNGIHGSILVYMMCIGKLPMKKSFIDYDYKDGWCWNNNITKTFIALEMFYDHNRIIVRMAESYQEFYGAQLKQLYQDKTYEALVMKFLNYPIQDIKLKYQY